MNRTISFRAWHETRKVWLHDKSWGGCHILGETILFGEWMRGLSIEELNDVTVEQNTGLKDSKGEDIYEGDLVRGTLSSGTVRDPAEWVGVIVYMGIYARFVAVGKDGDARPLPLMGGCEVCGNVHEVTT